MKKRYLLCISALLVLTFLTACSASTDTNLDPKNPVDITLWHYYAGEGANAIDEACAEFNRTVGMDKGIIVKSTGQGSLRNLEDMLMESVRNAVNSQPMPNIFSTYADTALSLDGYDVIANIDPYVSEEDLDVFVQSFLSDGYFDGTNLKILPIVKSSDILYVNNHEWQSFLSENPDFTDADLSTWDGLYGVLEAYYQHTGLPFAGVDSLSNYIIFLNRQQGIEVLRANGDGSGTVVIDRAAMENVWHLYYETRVLGYMAEYGNFRADDVKTGRIAAYLGSTSSASYFPTKVVTDDMEYETDMLAIPSPQFNPSNAIYVQQGAGMAISKATPAEEEASVEFLKWFTSQEMNSTFALATGYLPVNRHTLESESFTSAIDQLRTQDQESRNVAAVYDTAIQQILNSDTYAVKPFENTFSARRVLEETLQEITDQDTEAALALRSSGMSNTEALMELGSQERFEQWLRHIVAGLEAAEIDYLLQ